jgi:hypothetical protein
MKKITYPSLIFLFLLHGCAAPQYKTTYQTREVGLDKYYASSSEIKSIRSVSLSSSGILTIDAYLTRYQIEYEGPKMEQVTKVRRPADPVGALVNTAATVGLNLLLAPKQTGSQAVGDTQSEYVSNTYIDKSRARVTGRANWDTQATIFTGSVLIYGIKNQPIEMYLNGNNTDISSHLGGSSFASPLKIKVVCKFCEDLKEQQNSNFSSFTRQKDLDFNLDEFKSVQIKNNARIAQTDAQRKSISSGNSATQRCLSIGFSDGSEDFIKCIKTFTK